jgi:hypothetical protein
MLDSGRRMDGSRTCRSFPRRYLSRVVAAGDEAAAVIHADGYLKGSQAAFELVSQHSLNS